MRERLLEDALHRLLDCPELNLDEFEEETRAAIDAAAALLRTPGSSDLTELEHTVTYVGEQVELIRTVLEQLCDEVAALKKGLTAGRQRSLFQEPDGS